MSLAIHFRNLITILFLKYINVTCSFEHGMKSYTKVLTGKRKRYELKRLGD